MAMGYTRKLAGYSAPELLRKSSLDEKVDTWSLGCICFELCCDRKKFEGDVEVTELELESSISAIDQPSWLKDQNTSNTFGKWIKEMLASDHGGRPSAKDFGQRFDELLQHLIPPAATNEHTTNELTTVWSILRKEFKFLCPKYLLGTDVPPAYQGTLRFENVVPQGATRKEQINLCGRAKEIACAREVLLGREHNYTLWSKTLQAWARYLLQGATLQSRAAAAQQFRDLLALKGGVLGEQYPETVAVRAGLAWCMSNDNPAEAVQMFAACHTTQRQLLGRNHRETLSAKVGCARAFLSQLDAFSKTVEPPLLYQS